MVKKGPDRAPGGNGRAALAAGGDSSLDQDHDVSAEAQVINQLRKVPSLVHLLYCIQIEGFFVEH